MSLPYSATVFVNWLPVTCMPSPESPAKRITARSRTSRLVFGRGISVVVAIPDETPPNKKHNTRKRQGMQLGKSRPQLEFQSRKSGKPMQLRHLAQPLRYLKESWPVVEKAG